MAGLNGSVRSYTQEVARQLAMLVEASPAATRLGTKDELRARFGVSGATLNESLRVLQSQGLVELRTGPGGGVFTAEPSGRLLLSNLVVGFRGGVIAVRNVLESREALEPSVGQLAALRRSAADLRHFRKLLKTMQRHLDDPERYLRLNWQLHRSIAEATANDVLSGLYGSLVSFLEEELTQTLAAGSYVDHRKENLGLHERLVEAIEQHDEVGASRLAAHHAPVSMLEQADAADHENAHKRNGRSR